MQITNDIQKIARNIDIDTLPSVLMKDKNNLPNVPGVYFIESRNVILYIGMTENSLHQRFVQHHHKTRF